MHYRAPQTHLPLWLTPPLGSEETAVFLSTISWAMLPQPSRPRPMLVVGESWCSHQGNRGYHPHQGASQIPRGAPSTSDRPKAWSSSSVLFHHRPRCLLSELIDIGHARKSAAYVETDESANQNNPLGVHGHNSFRDLDVGLDSNHNAPLSSPRLSTPFCPTLFLLHPSFSTSTRRASLFRTRPMSPKEKSTSGHCNGVGQICRCNLLTAVGWQPHLRRCPCSVISHGSTTYGSFAISKCVNRSVC